jgi:hypothetical protein
VLDSGKRSARIAANHRCAYCRVRIVPLTMRRAHGDKRVMRNIGRKRLSVTRHRRVTGQPPRWMPIQQQEALCSD